MPTIIEKRQLQFIASKNEWKLHAEVTASEIVKDWLDSGKATSVILFFKSNNKDIDAYFPIMSNNPNGLTAKNLEGADKKSEITGIDPIKLDIKIHNGRLSDYNLTVINHKLKQKGLIYDNEVFIILDNIYEPNGIIVIESIKELTELFEKLDDLEYLKNKQYILTGPLVRFKLEGKIYQSSLPGSCFIGLATFQEKLKKIVQLIYFCLEPNHKLATEEVEFFQINVKVTNGCTDVWITMLTEDLIEISMNKMMANSYTAIGVACICAVAYCLKGIGAVSIKNIINIKLKSLAEKKANSNNDQERKEFELLESALSLATEALKAVSQGIIEAGSCKVRIDDNLYSLSKERIQYFLNKLPETPTVISKNKILDDKIFTATEEILAECEDRINEKLTYLKDKIENILDVVMLANGKIILEEYEQVFTEDNQSCFKKIEWPQDSGAHNKRKAKIQKLEEERRKKEEERRRKENGLKNSGG